MVVKHGHGITMKSKKRSSRNNRHQLDRRLDFPTKERKMWKKWEDYRKDGQWQMAANIMEL